MDEATNTPPNAEPGISDALDADATPSDAIAALAASLAELDAKLAHVCTQLDFLVARVGSLPVTTTESLRLDLLSGLGA